ncbi:MAG: response regulator [Pseudomonadota bacterium]
MSGVLSGIAEVVSALAALAIPLVAGWALWQILPEIKRQLSRGAVKINVGGAEISLQEASEGIEKQLADLQNRIFSIEELARDRLDVDLDAYNKASEALVEGRKLSILWVDDEPANNAYEVARLTRMGHTVQTALASAEALLWLDKIGVPCDLVISDAGRPEGGAFNADAAADLVEAIARQSETNGKTAPPVIVYTRRANLPRAMRAKAKGARAVVSSPVDLLMQIAGIAGEAGTV